MPSIFDKIKQLENIISLNKQEKIIQGTLEAVSDKIIEVGSKLPSIAKLAQEIGCANKTVVDAYSELKKRGIIESKSTRGNYLISTETNTKLKITLILYAFHSYQKEFYNSLRNRLGDKYQIDVFFHHNNISIFQTIINNTFGKYGFYIIAPMQQDDIISYFKQIPVDKLLLIDRWVDTKVYSYIIQEYEHTMYKKLTKLLSEIKKFDKIVLFFKFDEDYPLGLLLAFKKFVKDNNLAHEILEKYEEKDLQKNVVYFFVGQADFWELLKGAKEKELKIGKDIGILSLNDTIAKEISFGGITTITTDYRLMAKKTADYIILQKSYVQEIIPSEIIRRKSL